MHTKPATARRGRHISHIACTKQYRRESVSTTNDRCRVPSCTVQTPAARARSLVLVVADLARRVRLDAVLGRHALEVVKRHAALVGRVHLVHKRRFEGKRER
jgi:hypothetical protein